MAANEDSARPLAAPVVLGEDLSRLSEQELAERIALLQAEVLRVTAEPCTTAQPAPLEIEPVQRPLIHHDRHHRKATDSLGSPQTSHESWG